MNSLTTLAALVNAVGASLTSRPVLTAMSLVMAGAFGFAAAPLPSSAAENPRPVLDRFGDPLPPGAVRRFGTLRFRHDSIVDLAFTPDGKQLIAGCGCEPLSVFDAATGKCLRQVGKSYLGPSRGFALSPDGKRVVCCGSYVLVWDVETGRLIREFDFNRCISAAFSPDGKKIAAAKRIGAEVIVAEAATGKHLGEWKVKEGQASFYRFQSLAFSPDGKFLAGILSEHRETREGSRIVELVSSQVYLLDAATGKRVRAFGSPDHFIDAFGFQPGTGRLAGVGKDGALHFWEVGTGNGLHRLPAIKGWKYVPQFTADGRRCIALNNETGFLAVRDARDGRELRRIGIDASIHPSIIAVSPDGRTIAEAKSFGGVRVRVWDIETGVERLAGAGHNGGAILSLSADGRTLISREGKGLTFHWDLRTGECRHKPAAAEKESDGISWLEQRRTIRGRNWRLTIDYEKKEMEVRSPDGSRLLRKIAYLEMPRSFAFSPDGAHLAIAFDDRRNTIFLWDPEKEEKPRTLAGHPYVCDELLFTHDGKRLIAATGTGNSHSSPTVWIWDVATARLVHKLGTNSCGEMLLTADDRVLLTGGQWDDATVHVWDMETGKELARLPDPSLKHTNMGNAGDYPPEIGGLALSADERFLAVVSGWDNRSAVRVWETSSWKLVRAFAPTQPRYGVASMVFSRDGRSLFVSSSDSTILEWDVSRRFDKKTETPNRDRLDVLWWTLAETADKAYPAAWEMLDHSALSVPFLIGKLAPVKPIDEQSVRKLLEKLDAESFAEREEANRQLLALGEQTLPVLRQALRDKPSLETKKRIERVVDELTGALAPEQLRLLRALTVLEWSNRAEAGEHLQRMAGGDPTARLTRAAEAARRRR